MKLFSEINWIKWDESLDILSGQWNDDLTMMMYSLIGDIHVGQFHEFFKEFLSDDQVSIKKRTNKERNYIEKVDEKLLFLGES